MFKMLRSSGQLKIELNKRNINIYCKGHILRYMLNQFRHFKNKSTELIVKEKKKKLRDYIVKY